MINNKINQNGIFKKIYIICIVGISIGLISTNRNSIIILLTIYSMLLSYFVLKKRKMQAVYVYIYFLMIHTLVIYHIVPTILNLNNTMVSILSIWKEALILFLSIFIFIKNKNKIKKFKENDNSNQKKLNIYIYIFIYICLFSFILSNNYILGLYGIRNYLFCFLFLYVFKNIDLEYININYILNKVANFIFILSIWGLFQAFVLGHDFLIKYGYANETGYLDTPFYISGYFGIQRVSSTFDSPNSFGLITMIGVLYFINKIFILKERSKLDICKLSVIIVALIFTFSRSSWIATFIASIYLINKSNKKLFKKGIAFIVPITIIIFFIVLIFLGINGEMNRTNSMLLDYITRTFTLKDTSVVGHIDSYLYSIEYMIKHPFGIGIGSSGPRIAKYNVDIVNTESSYFLIGFDMGFVGLAIYLLLIYSLIKALSLKREFTNYKINNSGNLISSMWIGIFVIYLFLPMIQDILHLYIMFIITGIQLSNNKKVGD